MPFSSQPRKKGLVPQDSKKESCGHTKPNKNCEQCRPRFKIVSSDPNPTATPPTNSAEEKKKILVLQQKIIELFSKDPRGAEKAAFIISQWITRKK